MKPLNVYFDTNALLDLIHPEARSVDYRHPGAIRKAVRKGKVRVHVSIFNIEEILPRLCKEPEQVRYELAFLADISERTWFIKQPSELVIQAVKSCVLGCPTESTIESAEQIWSRLESDLNPRRPCEAIYLFGAQRDTRVMTERFRANMAEYASGFREYCRVDLGGDDPRSKPPPFEEAWFTLTGSFARDLVKGAGITREIDDSEVKILLENKCIRLAAGDLAARTYAGFFQGHTPKEGDSRDNLHAISASAADIFVTGDGRFRDYLAQIPSLPIEVLDLAGLIARL